MCCQNFWKKIVPFALALTLGLLAADVLRTEISVNKIQENLKSVEKKIAVEYGEGIGEGHGHGNGEPTSSSTNPTTAIKILSKPQAKYTDAARQNNVQGTIALRVVFTAAGTIGSITPVTELPDGLTEEAIAAARQIKFEPARKNGIPYSIAKTVSYSFTIY